MSEGIVIESRVQLFSALSEAAEVEHDLMCLYLYATFSLKRTADEGLTPDQLDAVTAWRRTLLGVALEEMNHLTLVSNLMVAIGGSPNFMRPNFPVPRGMYPADLVIELAPFDMSTVEHFIYLERPESYAVPDGATFPHLNRYSRHAPHGRLMPSAGDYETVGDLYRAIRAAVERLADEIGDEKLFLGSRARQIGPLDSPLPGLTLVTDRASALRALDTIVVQGEGATSMEGSHFARFSSMRDEYLQLLAKDPTFAPARAVARNPVMREPPEPEGRVWVREPLAARYMDLANTLYTGMLRILVQVYAVEDRSPASKRAMIETSVDVMRAMASVGETLTHLPANVGETKRAGMSFAMVRSLAPLESGSETPLLVERLTQIGLAFEQLSNDLESGQVKAPDTCLAELRRSRTLIEACRQRLVRDPCSTSRAATPPVVNAPPSKPVAPAPATPSLSAQPGRELAKGKSLLLSFEAKRCIHSRHCVTELPRVFKANTPGTWLFPDEADGETLAAVARECPSGAIQYERTDGGPAEAAPEVNLLRVRENGPYAVLADMELAGASPGYRATLCRCGQSKNKPFCDGSHVAAKFVASGEPDTMDATALTARGGTLRVEPTPNGPLAVTGNLEICAGTGRVVLRTQSARLCRCGHSKNKPLCDGSHVKAGFVSEPPAEAARAPTSST